MIKSFLKSHFISGRIAGEKMKKNCDFIKPLALLSKVKRDNVPKGPSFLILILSVSLSASLIKTIVRRNESKMYYVCSNLKYPHNMAKSFLKSHFISGGKNENELQL